jgi:ATP-dependent Clp protease adaptor protein ClpS
VDSLQINTVPQTGALATAPDAVLFYTGRRFSPIVVSRGSDKDPRAEDKGIYEVRIMDNDYNTYDQVIRICMAALNINEAQAFVVAWEVDHYGSCAVAQGPYEEAESLAALIRTIGIEVQVNPVGSGEIN